MAASSKIKPTDWWYYFDKINDNKDASCKFCEWVKPRGDSKSTTKLKQHLSQGSDSYLFYKYCTYIRPPYLWKWKCTYFI